MYQHWLSFDDDSYNPRVLQASKKIQCEDCEMLWCNNILKVDIQDKGFRHVEVRLSHTAGPAKKTAEKPATTGQEGEVKGLTEVAFIAAEMFEDFDQWPQDVHRFRRFDLNISFGPTYNWNRQVHHQLCILAALTCDKYRKHDRVVLNVHANCYDRALLGLKYFDGARVKLTIKHVGNQMTEVDAWHSRRQEVFESVVKHIPDVKAALRRLRELQIGTGVDPNTVQGLNRGIAKLTKYLKYMTLASRRMQEHDTIISQGVAALKLVSSHCAELTRRAEKALQSQQAETTVASGAAMAGDLEDLTRLFHESGLGE